MMGNIQAMISMVIRVSQLYQEGKVSMPHIALTKGFCSKKCREVVAVARELMGGNGILLENHVIKQFLDAEALYTYEGTYEVNCLVAARELTGFAAFK